MAGAAAGNLLISGIFYQAAGVTGNDLDDTFNLFKIGFRAPETTAGKNGGCGFLCVIFHVLLHFIHAINLLIAEQDYCKNDEYDM